MLLFGKYEYIQYLKFDMLHKKKNKNDMLYEKQQNIFNRRLSFDFIIYY